MNAFAFMDEGIAFIALTDRIIERLIHISSKMWRLNLLGDILRIQTTTEARNYIAAALLPIQIQILSSHELGHFFHGHCADSPGLSLRAEINLDSDHPRLRGASRLRNQAMEVEADGYAVHMILKNLIQGEMGENLYKLFGSALPVSEFVMAFFLISTGSLFYLLGERHFDSAAVEGYDHPPALMRMNVIMRDMQGWCSEHSPELIDWGTTERFQDIMQAIALADETGANLNDWQVQGQFLLSEPGRQYIERLYAEREKLRAEMEPFQWHLTPKVDGGEARAE